MADVRVLVCFAEDGSIQSISSNHTDFLLHLVLQGKEVNTIRGFITALASTLEPLQKWDSGWHGVFHVLISYLANERSPKVKSIPSWDLGLVLLHLKGHPFEPIQKISLKLLTLKTVLLLSLASSKRVSELLALTFRSVRYPGISGDYQKFEASFDPKF